MQKKRPIRINNKIRISKTARSILILLSVAIIAFGSGNLIKTVKSKNQIMIEDKEVYKYTNYLRTDQNINLKENQYISEEEITKDQTYLSDLISDIDIGYKYNYTGTVNTEIIYNYKIEAIVSATYSSNGKTYDVLNKTELIKQSEDTSITANSFVIDENVDIDYTKYHEMIKDFKQDMGISANSNLYIRLTVNTRTNINSQEVNNTYVADYSITLGEKISIVSYEIENAKTDSVKYQVEREEIKELNKKSALISAFIVLIGFVMLIIVLRRTEELRAIRNEFKLELNRIMRSCESKLVQIEDIKQIDIKSATKVRDIEQLLKLSDEALVPIYCYIKEEPEQEAYFIVTKYEHNYIYILK